MAIEIKMNRRYVPDNAWRYDNNETNYSLKNGDTVTLLHSTRGDCSRGYALIPPGTSGVVVKARTPRVFGSGYFANVEVFIDDEKFRIRVPHNALSKAG